MPLSSGMSIHDDTKHKGSAKRDALSGVAALGAGGNLLAAGFAVELTRTGADNVVLGERTSGENIQYWHRVGIESYVAYLKVSGVDKVIQHAGLKDIANGIAGLDANTKLLSPQMPLPMLTVAQFQANAATGTANNPANMNDAHLGTRADFNAIGEYAEVQLDHYNFITKYRMYGFSQNNEDGAYKIQHYEDGAWVDNTLNIPTNLGVWSSWALLDIPVYTKAIRIVATAIDSGLSTSDLTELEIEG